MADGERDRMAAATPAPLTSEQRQARERWQSRWNLPILIAALLPLFVTSPRARAVEIIVGVGSWLVFAVDLVVQRRIVPDYLHRREGKIDMVIVVLTCPFYLIPGVSSGSAILLLARLGRVVRLLLATTGLRRFAARLGRVAIVAGLVVVVASLAAYQAEHPTNPEFATVGDSLWWGIVTLTTVGYGDIVPLTTAGRIAGVAIMITGIGVLGVLAGSLSALFHLETPSANRGSNTTEQTGAPASHQVAAELAKLQAQLQAVEAHLSELAELIRRGQGESE